MTKKCVVMVLMCLLAATSFVGCKEETKSSKRTREYDAMILQTTSRKLSSIYSATIRGKQDIDIRPKVQGYITDIKVNEGSIVRQGQTLFIIDQVPYQAALATAEANVDVAKAQVDAAELSATSKEKPVGTVWIGVATPDRCYAVLKNCGTDRSQIIARATAYAITMLYDELHNEAKG